MPPPVFFGLTKLGKNHPWGKGIQSCLNDTRGPHVGSGGVLSMAKTL